MKSETFQFDGRARATAPSTASMLLDDAVERGAGPSVLAQPFATGFMPLDDVLGGGFRGQELILLGGRPGVGKTIAALQWARWFAMQSRTAIYVCYEHSPQTLLGRLFALELGALVRSDEVASLDGLRALARDVALGAAPMDHLLKDPLGEEAVGRLRSYGERLQIVQASGASTDLDAIEAVARSHQAGAPALIVDYLQKIPVAGAPDEDTRTTGVVESLKDLAMKLDIPVVALVASDKPGIMSRRLRLDHFHGSAALAHECDVALVLNEKSLAVSKRHLAYDSVRAESFRNKVVMSVEKNRGGPTGMNMEFTKDFANYRFDPDGGFVGEMLVDDLYLSE